MPDAKPQHMYFRVEYTLTWNPTGEYFRSVVADPPVTLDDAIAVHLRALDDYATNGRWVRLDGARVVRAVDVLAFTIVPVQDPAEDYSSGFAIGAEEEEPPGNLLSREKG